MLRWTLRQSFERWSCIWVSRRLNKNFGQRKANHKQDQKVIWLARILPLFEQKLRSGLKTEEANNELSSKFKVVDDQNPEIELLSKEAMYQVVWSATRTVFVL